MATAEELRVWATTVRYWASRINDPRTAGRAEELAAELDAQAACEEAVERHMA